MSYRIEWAPTALLDLEEILDYVTIHNSSESAARVGTKILARVASLSEHPQRRRVVPELQEFGVRDYREAIVPPYRVCFRLTRRTVGIVGVLDGRRDLAEILIQRYLLE
jgi:plasmid stabilization system protein ParE